MGFLKRLFGGGQKEYVDKDGLYFYVQCDNCGKCVQVRASKQYDLNRQGGGFVWHKTIVDNRCFRPMQTVVYLDSNYTITSHEIEGGHYITEEEYEAAETAATAKTNVDQATDEEASSQ